MKKRFFTISFLITVLCSLLVGCGDLSYGSISGNHPTDAIVENSEDPTPEQADPLPEQADPLPEQADSLSGQDGSSMESSENVSDTASTDDTIGIPEEYLSENSGIEYTVNENGEYVYDGMLFRHKLILTRRLPTDKHSISIYIVLTNDTELTAEKIFKDGLSSKAVPLDVAHRYPSQYLILGHHVYEESHDSEDPLPEQADSLSGQNGSMESSENVSDTASTDDTIDIPEEYLSENSGVEYTVNENGEYVWNGQLFRHKLVLTSRAPTDKHFISIYIVLTNDTKLTAEKIIKDHLSSKAIPIDRTQEYPSYYIVVGNHVYEEPH